MSERHLTLDEARRIALAAQGFDRPRPGRAPSMDDVRRVVRRTGLLQLDYVTVVGPAHEHVIFSRIGPYDTARLDRMAYRTRELTEQWAREASLVPVAWWPLLRSRRERHRARPWGFDAVLARHPEYVARIVDEIRERGPLAASDLHAPPGVDRRLAESWYGTFPRATLEALFGRGVLAVAHRRSDRSRAFDLAERVVPAEHHDRVVTPDEAMRELAACCARSLGVATAADVADYVRVKVGEMRPRLDELVADGRLERVRVEGWREPAYLDHAARIPRHVRARALLSPFDPLVWYRPRLERLFGFDYRLEIFVPDAQRRWGAYVLPFLLGDRMVARVDLKTERREDRLHVRAAFLEDGAERDVVATELAEELAVLARWLGLARVTVGRRGNLAGTLSKAVTAARRK